MLLKSMLSSLVMILLIGVIAAGGFYINQKINQMNQLWLDANQIIVANQKEQFKINQLYSNQIDQLINHIGNLNQNERIVWLTNYNQSVQDFLMTPPAGLSRQGNL